MIKSMTFLWIILAVAVSGALFRVSYRVQHLQRHLVVVNHDIGQEQEKIRVLQAEWNKLNDPARLEMLAHRHLNMGPAKPVQIVTLDLVPTKTLLPAVASARVAKATPAPVTTTPATTVSAHVVTPTVTQKPILASLTHKAVDD
jgi:cell division protein FtsL